MSRSLREERSMELLNISRRRVYYRVIDFNSSKYREMESHLGALNKSPPKIRKGGLSDKSNALKNQETNLFFEKRTAGKHYPKAPRNAIRLVPAF